MLFVSCGEKKYETVKGDPLKTKIYTLDNGLKVYMSVNKDEPRLQTYIAVNSGGANDPSDNTGLAHYLEHLMFKGSENLGTSDYAAEKVILDRIEALFETYKATTDPAERKALYHVIDSLSYEASKISIPNEYDKAMAIIGAQGTNAFTSNDVTCYTGINQKARYMLENTVYNNRVTGVSVSPSGKYVTLRYTYGKEPNRQRSTTELLDAKSGKVISTLPEGLRWMPKSDKFYYVRQGDLVTVDPVTRQEEVLFYRLPQTDFRWMPDEKTMFCFWDLAHGGPTGPAAKSTDGGRTWTDISPRPYPRQPWFVVCQPLPSRERFD